MANVLLADCTLNSPNVGPVRCAVDPGLLQGVILIKKGTRYTAAQLQSIVPTLAAAAITGNKLDRAYPIGPFISVTDSSTDTVTETTDFGFTEIVRDGTYVWRGRTAYGGVCLYRNLRMFNNKQGQYDVIFVFKKHLLMTYSPNPTTGAPEYMGINPSLIHVPIWKIAAGNTSSQFMFEVQVFDASQIADNFMFVNTEVSALSSIMGITGVDIQNNAVFNTTPAGSIDVLPVAECDGSSLLTVYGSTWANVNLWTATNAATGAPITITGVSQVNGKYRIQLDVTDLDYPAVGGRVIISAAAVGVLNAAGIIGYETNTVTLTRTA